MFSRGSKLSPTSYRCAVAGSQFVLAETAEDNVPAVSRDHDVGAAFRWRQRFDLGDCPGPRLEVEATLVGQDDVFPAVNRDAVNAQAADHDVVVVACPHLVVADFSTGAKCWRITIAEQPILVAAFDSIQ